MVMEIPNPNAAEAVGAVAGIAMRTSAKSRTRMMRVLRMLSPFPAYETRNLSGAGIVFELNRRRVLAPTRLNTEGRRKSHWPKAMEIRENSPDFAMLEGVVSEVAIPEDRARD
jgi:hypothetical protein